MNIIDFEINTAKSDIFYRKKHIKICFLFQIISFIYLILEIITKTDVFFSGFVCGISSGALIFFILQNTINKKDLEYSERKLDLYRKIKIQYEYELDKCKR